jgi:transposase-like protein
MDTTTVTAQALVGADTRSRRAAARRHRSIEEKLAILAETQLPGASVAAVARRHGVNANVVFGWRRLHERGVLEQHTRPLPRRRLVPVRLLESPAVPATGGVRIEFPSGIVLQTGSLTDMVLMERLIELLRR